MADRITKIVVNRPTVVTFHGSDVLGQQLSGPVRKLISHFGVWTSEEPRVGLMAWLLCQK